MTAGRRWATRAGRWLGGAVLLALLGLLVVTVVVPKLGGATPYTVLTGSMRPGLPPGTFLAVRPVDPDDIGVGSVVTYQLESGRPEVVTHRVVGVAVRADGTPLFRTQGDANSTPDSRWVLPVQVRGELWYAVPHVGRVSSFLTDSRREILVPVLAVALLGYGTAQLLAGLRGRVRRAPAPTLRGRVHHG